MNRLQKNAVKRVKNASKLSWCFCIGYVTKTLAVSEVWIVSLRQIACGIKESLCAWGTTA